MGSIQEIDNAVRRLPAADLEKFRAWFVAFDASNWDELIETDAAAGRLDDRGEAALPDFREGCCTDL